MTRGELRKENARAMVVGASGSGKTWWIKRHLIPHRDRVLIIDPQAEYGDVADAIVSTPRLARAWLIGRGAAHHRAPFRLSCIPADADAAIAYMRLAWSLPSSLCVLEEIDTYSTASYAPPELRQLVQRGRHRRIDTVAVSQRPAGTPTVVRSQAGGDLIVAFRLSTARDVDAVKFWIPDASDALYNLSVGEYRYAGSQVAARRLGVSLPIDAGRLV